MNTTAVDHTRRALMAALGGTAALAAMPAWAQNDRPIRFILPLSVGSGVDAITRAAGPALSAALGHTVVVENQAGAGGIVGTSALVRSPPDGLTLSMVSNNHVIYPSVYKSLPFDPIADITPISVVCTTPFLLVVNPKRLPVKTVPELVAMLREKSDAFNYASSGNGTVLHLAAELFMQQAGLKVRHIPYKGTGPMVTDLIGGQVDVGVVSLPSALPHVQSGALVALGVCGPQRTATLPNLPTVREQGMPDYEIEGWVAVVGPAKLPKADVDRIYAGFQKAYASPEVKAQMATQGNTVVLRPPAETAAYFVSELKKYAAIVKASGLEAQ